MKFIQKNSDGSCEIKFSWRERFILFFRGSLHLDSLSLRHFSNNLMKMITAWNVNFNKDVRNKVTSAKDPIQGK